LASHYKNEFKGIRLFKDVVRYFLCGVWVIGWWGGVGVMGGMGGTYQRLSPHTREQVFAIVCGLHNFRCGLIDFFKQFSAFVLALSFDNKTALRAGRKSVAEGSKQWATMDVGGGWCRGW